jgi:hypothetical protein
MSFVKDTTNLFFVKGEKNNENKYSQFYTYIYLLLPIITYILKDLQPNGLEAGHKLFFDYEFRYNFQS